MIDLITKVSDKAKENPSPNNISGNSNSAKKEMQIIENQIIANKKINLKVSKNKILQYTIIPKNLIPKSQDLLITEPLHSINIQKTEITFNLTDIKPVEVVLPRKLRVMHIEDFQIQPMEKITQPKTFYVFFNKEFNIDNQLPTVSIAHPNNIN